MTVKLPSFVLISRDTIHLELKNFEDRISKKFWCLSAFSVFISCASAILTATQFNDFLGISGSTWHGVFIIATLLGLFLTIVFALKWLCQLKQMSTEYALEQICSTSELAGPVEISTPANTDASVVPVNFGTR